MKKLIIWIVVIFLLMILGLSISAIVNLGKQRTNNADKQNYIVVKELGFKIPIDDSMVDEITYQEVEDFTVGFSTKSLNSAGFLCEEGAGGRITKVSDTPSAPGMSNAEFFEGREADIKQFDGFFFFYQRPQSICTRDRYEEEVRIIEIIREGFDNISLLK